MTQPKPIKFTVQGRGDFPWDMLRYDRAYPVTDPSPHRYESEESWRQVRTVELIGQSCTPARWSSFSWTVTTDLRYSPNSRIH
jgi:hypothetical protein